MSSKWKITCRPTNTHTTVLVGVVQQWHRMLLSGMHVMLCILRPYALIDKSDHIYCFHAVVCYLLYIYLMMTKSNGALSVVLLILVRLPSHPNIVFNRNQHWNIEPLSHWALYSVLSMISNYTQWIQQQINALIDNWSYLLSWFFNGHQSISGLTWLWLSKSQG